MKLRPLLLAFGLVAAATLSAFAQRTTLTDTLKAAVLRADETRIYALLSPDLGALDDMLTPDCAYIHSNGVAQTKAQLLQAIKSGAMKYLSIRYSAPPTVRIYGNESAILNAPAQIEVQIPDGKTVKLSLQTTAVYVVLHDRWQLASYHSTVVPAAAPAPAK